MCPGSSESRGGDKARLGPVVTVGSGALDFHPSRFPTCLDLLSLSCPQGYFYVDSVRVT